MVPMTPVDAVAAPGAASACSLIFLASFASRSRCFRDFGNSISGNGFSHTLTGADRMNARPSIVVIRRACSTWSLALVRPV